MSANVKLTDLLWVAAGGVAIYALWPKSRSGGITVPPQTGTAARPSTRTRTPQTAIPEIDSSTTTVQTIDADTYGTEAETSLYEQQAQMSPDELAQSILTQGLNGYGDAPTSAQFDAVYKAMDRYKAAALQAAMMCATSDANPLQQIFEWATGSTFTGSICARAAQMKINIDAYDGYISDPNTTDEQLREILGFIKQETNISDLVELYEASRATTIVGKALDPRNVVPTAVGLVPWWVWAIGAVGAANALGVFKRT